MKEAVNYDSTEVRQWRAAKMLDYEKESINRVKLASQ